VNVIQEEARLDPCEAGEVATNGMERVMNVSALAPAKKAAKKTRR